MQQFYGRLFKEGSAKKNNFDIFTKKEEKSLERSIELINTMKSPQKIETIEIEERFETELHSTEQEDYRSEKQKVTVSVSVETEEMATEERDNSEIKTLKQLSLVSEGIIFLLLSEFS